MDRPVLVDSNIYIELLRRGVDPAMGLTAHVSQLDLATCGMIRLEVLRGIKVERMKTRLGMFFDVMQSVPTDNRLWEQASELAWTMDRQGRVIPAQDIVIACCARRIGAVVLTRDAHFRAVPGLTVRDLDF